VPGYGIAEQPVMVVGLGCAPSLFVCPPLASTISEPRRRQRLKYRLDGHAKTQQLVVIARQPIDLEPHRQTVARKSHGNAESWRTECRTKKRVP
jgi:hypothetical protein